MCLQYLATTRVCKMQINIDEIKLTKRIRKDIGDITSLANNINEIGLLHPIALSETNELICGYRRLEAFKKLQRKEIPYTRINLPNLVKGEFSENAFRKDLTFSEMVETKRILTPEIRREAEIRMKSGKPAPKLGKGRSTEIIAKALGLGHTSLEKAEKLVDAAEKQPEKFKGLLDRVDNGETSLESAYRQLIKSERMESLEVSKDKKQVREQITGQGLASTPNEKIVKEHDLHTPSSEPSIIESLRNEIKNLKQERDYFVGKLGEKSPDFPELYEENRQLKEIERKRIKHDDFSTAASLPATIELQQKIESLEKRINELETLLARNRFEAVLELRGRNIPVIINIDRISGEAKITIDTSKTKSGSRLSFDDTIH